jgi:hypothetical protein
LNTIAEPFIQRLFLPEMISRVAGAGMLANDSGTAEDDRYQLLLDGARFADENGFHAVWTLERHFHPCGGTYPNRSVTGAAIASTFASGWHATDFALNPSAYADRRTVMYERVEQVRALWRGEESLSMSSTGWGIRRRCGRFHLRCSPNCRYGSPASATSRPSGARGVSAPGCRSRQLGAPARTL